MVDMWRTSSWDLYGFIYTNYIMKYPLVICYMTIENGH